jgi:hypothetical protein
MSCEACSQFQDSDRTSFFRWGVANVEIRACTEHLTSMFQWLRIGIDPKQRRMAEAAPDLLEAAKHISEWFDLYFSEKGLNGGALAELRQYRAELKTAIQKAEGA